jgi:hypothetical protein
MFDADSQQLSKTIERQRCGKCVPRQLPDSCRQRCGFLESSGVVELRRMQMRWSLPHSITWHANSASVRLFTRQLSLLLSVTQSRSSTGFVTQPVKVMHSTK